MSEDIKPQQQQEERHRHHHHHTARRMATEAPRPSGHAPLGRRRWWEGAGSSVSVRAYSWEIHASDLRGVDVVGGGLGEFQVFKLSWSPTGDSGDVIFTASDFRSFSAHDGSPISSSSSSSPTAPTAMQQRQSFSWSVASDTGEFGGLIAVDEATLESASAMLHTPRSPVGSPTPPEADALSSLRAARSPVLIAVEQRARAWWNSLAGFWNGADPASVFQQPMSTSSGTVDGAVVDALHETPPGQRERRADMQQWLERAVGTSDLSGRVIIQNFTRLRKDDARLESRTMKPVRVSTAVRLRTTYQTGTRVSSASLSHHLILVPEWSSPAPTSLARDPTYVDAVAQGEAELAELREAYVTLDPVLEQKLSQAFLACDSDGSGEIDKSELAAMLTLLYGKPALPAEVDHAMDELDTDKSGTVDYDEFRRWVLSKPSFQKKGQPLVRDRAVSSTALRTTSGGPAPAASSQPPSPPPPGWNRKRGGSGGLAPLADIQRLSNLFDVQGEVTVRGKKESQACWAVLVPRSQRLDLYRDSHDGPVVHLVPSKKGHLLSSLMSLPNVDLEFETDGKAAMWDSAIVSCVADHSLSAKSASGRIRFDQYQALCSSLADLILAVLETGVWAE